MKKILLSSIVAISLNAAGFLVIDGDKAAYFTINEHKDKVEFVSGMETFQGDVCFKCNDTYDKKLEFEASKSKPVKYDSISLRTDNEDFKIRYLVGANKEELNLNEFFTQSLNHFGTLEITEDVFYAQNELTSVRFQLIEDNKGAHPMHFAKFAILNKNSEIITSNFAFKNADTLKATIGKKLKDYLKTKNHNEKDNEFFSPIELNNFYFDKYGIVFSYSPYELLSYASGYIKVRLNYKEIKPFLTKEFEKLLKDNEIIK